MLAEYDLSSREGQQEAVAALGEYFIEMRNESAEPHYLQAMDQMLMDADQAPLFHTVEEVAEDADLPTSPDDAVEQDEQAAYSDSVLSAMADGFMDFMTQHDYTSDQEDYSTYDDVDTRAEYPELYNAFHGQETDEEEFDL
jgi:hypothetical protein